jgi:uncharacterized protein (DUF433 family)
VGTGEYGMDTVVAAIPSGWRDAGQTDGGRRTGCPLVEVKPGVQSGVPVLRGTRMPADAIVDNFDYGLDIAEIVDQFEVPRDRGAAILNYAKSHRVAHRIR